MSQLTEAKQMLAAAERAASTGDLGAAGELLRKAAKIQEAELGAFHADLASTLNNLAIVAEKTDRPGEAEAFYRRAAAIAAASLPADHPMVAASRQNLEDFCRAAGLPVGKLNFDISPMSGLEEFADEKGAETGAAALKARNAQKQKTSPMVWLGLAAVAAIAVALMATRPWSTDESAGPAPRRESAAQGGEPVSGAPPQTAAAPIQEPPAPAPSNQPPAPKPIPQSARDDVAPPTPAKVPPGRVSLAETEVCRTLSTSGGQWRCDAIDDTVRPGPLVLYTRVRSSRDAAVIHRWYRGDTLQRTVKLNVRANAREGFRTYSRQTVNAGADWRVEVRGPDNELLHEQRFAVR
jgi:Protein of unknown function (DUF2914)/Tetratricopeptide repeat